MPSATATPRSWNLRDFADHHLRDEPPRKAVREAGPICAWFIDRWAKQYGRGDRNDDAVRAQAEDQLASAAIAFATGIYPPSPLPPAAFRGQFWLGTCRPIPIIVVHGNGQRRYVAIYEDLAARWDTESPVQVRSLDVGDSEQRLGRVFESFGLEGIGAWPDDLGGAVLEVLKAWRSVPVIVMPVVPRVPTVDRPTAATSVAAGSASATIGVVGTRYGIAAATTAAHAIGAATSVQIAKQACPVLQVDLVQDAAAIDLSGLTTALATSPITILAGIVPVAGVAHTFDGATSGTVSDIVVGWDASIPWVSPSSPVQSHVYTGACSMPGDSGAALVDPWSQVVGFAQFRSPAATAPPGHASAFPGISGWVWAESVLTALAVT